MLGTRLGLGEEIGNLDLRWKVVKGDNLIANRAASEMGIYTNMFGQLMLDGISNNLKGTDTVTVKWCRRSNADAKILKNQSKLDKLANRSCQGAKLSLNTGVGDSSLLLGLPSNQGRAKKDTKARDGVGVIRGTRPSSIRVRLKLKCRLAGVEKTPGSSPPKIA